MQISAKYTYKCGSRGYIVDNAIVKRVFNNSAVKI